MIFAVTVSVELSNGQCCRLTAVYIVETVHKKVPVALTRASSIDNAWHGTA